jgi:hypothetical protein
MSLFEKGRAKTGGRRKGVKDRIGTMFLEELAKDFEEHGPEVIRLARIERRVEYLKIIGSVARCQKTRLGWVDLSTSIAACDQVAKLKGENGNHSCQTPQKAL